MKTYKFKRDNQIVECIARRESEARTRLKLCFAKRAKKYERVPRDLPIIFLESGEVERCAFHETQRGSSAKAYYKRKINYGI